MKRLSLREIVKLSSNFIGKEWFSFTKEEKMRWINAYREVEDENEAMIAKYGSVCAWYESGEGRSIYF